MLLLALAAQAAPLSLADALAAAAANNPDLLDATYALDAARADTTGARAAFDPTLTLGGQLDGAESRSFLAGYPTSSTTEGARADLALGGTLGTGTTWSVAAALDNQVAATETSFGGVASEQETDTWASSLSVSASQDLLAFLRPSDARAALRKATERADQEALAALDSRERALATVAEAWWGWSAAFSAEDVARRSVEEAVARETRTVAWVEAGQTAPVELARVRADRLAAEEALARAEAAVIDAADALLVAMGAAPGTALEPAGDGALPPRAADLDAALARARAANPTFLLARARRDAARAAERDVRFDALPALSVGVSAGLGTLADTASTALADLSDDPLPSWSAGVDLSVPLGGRAARASRDAAATTTARADLALADAERTLDADVRAAHRGLATAAQALALATARLDVARQTEAGEEARLTEGTRRMDQLLDAARARQDAEVDVIEARRDVWRAALTAARLEGDVAGLLAGAK